MTQITRRRRKKRRFYWVELGFLLLGLIGLRPEILTELFPNNRSNTTALIQDPANQSFYAPAQSPVGAPMPPWTMQPIYPPEPHWGGYGYPPNVNQPQPQPQLAVNTNYPATGYPATGSPPTEARVASNPNLPPSEVTSRYSTNAGYAAYGSTSSNTSTPPVVWPEGYQPSGYQPNRFPPSSPNIYRR